MDKEKLIRQCPVCGSKKIEQDWAFSVPERMGQKGGEWRDGSHCEDCGVKFVLNCEPEKKDKLAIKVPAGFTRLESREKEDA